MAASCLKRLLLPAAIATLLAAPPAGAALTAIGTSHEPIQLDAQSSELDYGSNQLLFRKVKISQGAMSISADSAHATGLDFDNSQWVFQGNVHITMEEGQLASDEADVTFVRKQLAHALITGKPAAFEQHNAPNGKPVQGHANSIEFNVEKGLIHFMHDAWLSDGQNEIRNESIKYLIAEHRMIADSADQGAQRVHITITPPPAAPTKP